MRDVLVIGGGPAGCVAGIALARGGWKVGLVEQHRFPRDKVCGECISPVALDVLRRLDLYESTCALGAVAINRAELLTVNGDSASIVLPRPMWGLSRRTLDYFLLEAARREGVTIHQPARCESIECKPRLCVRVRDLVTNEIRMLHASHVVLADGKGALLSPRPGATADLGIKASFVDVAAAPDAVTLFGARGHYGGVAPVDGGRWNVALSAPVGLVRRHEADLESLFVEMLGKNRTMAKYFRHARRVGAWLAAPLPRFAVRPSWPRGLTPVGNAAAALEPIGGEGIGLAMRSAELAAEALLDGDDMHKLRRRFNSLWRIRRAMCRAAAMTVASRQGASAARIIAGNRVGATVVMWGMGKGLPRR